MPRHDGHGGRKVTGPERLRPISSYDEYQRRYFPDDDDYCGTSADADPTEVGEEVGRKAVETAVARLTGTDEDP
jgi:hypothetical protein